MYHHMTYHGAEDTQLLAIGDRDDVMEATPALLDLSPPRRVDDQTAGEPVREPPADASASRGVR